MHEMLQNTEKRWGGGGKWVEIRRVSRKEEREGESSKESLKVKGKDKRQSKQPVPLLPTARHTLLTPSPTCLTPAGTFYSNSLPSRLTPGERSTHTAVAL